MSFARPYVPALGWAMLTLGLYAIPGSDMPSNGFWEVLSLDKVGHASVFAVLSCSLIVAFRRQLQSERLRSRAFVYAVGAALVYGGLLEWLQGQAFQQRTSDWLDFAANVVGCFLGVLIFRFIYRKC